MKAILSELNSLLANAPDNKRRRQGYPDKVKVLCIKLADSIGVKEASRQSGVGKVSIYKWIREGSYLQEKQSVSRDKACQRPLVLQEVEATSAIAPIHSTREITLISAVGVTVHLPADDQTLGLVLDRMMGGRL
jgi:hypothetical protein